MNPSTLPKPQPEPLASSTTLPPETTDGRDLRAKRQGLFRTLTDRHLLARLANGLLLAAIDVLLLTASLMLALRTKAAFTSDVSTFSDSIDYAINVLPLAVLVMLLLFGGDGLYRQRHLRPGAAQIIGSLFKVTVVVLIFALVEGARFNTYYAFWGTFIFASVLIVGARMLYDRGAERIEGIFGRQRRAVIVGHNRQIDAVADALAQAKVKRIRAVGFVCLEPREENGLRDLGSLDSIEDHFGLIDEVILADPTYPVEETVMLVDRCHRGGVHLRVAPTTMEILRADVAEFVPGESLPLFEVKPPVFDGVQFVVKRVFDLVVAAILVVLLSPVLAVVALAVKLTSRGPVFFRSPRPGLGGEPFKCIKFRTMVTNADSLQDELEELNEADGAIFKIRQDPRLTSIGAVLRKWSLDELPQLFNVLAGQMSLVGPRPLPHRDYERLEEWHKKRYLVLPGLTGLWQVSGRSELEFDDLVRLDFHYIERWSVFFDIVILLRTIPAVFAKRGAF